MKHVLIFGDVMIDEYIYGSVRRISPEAPVPVLRIEKNENRIGGAGNVANNVIALGAEAAGIFVIGDDNNAEILKELLKEKGIKTEWIIRDKNNRTIKQ